MASVTDWLDGTWRAARHDEHSGPQPLRPPGGQGADLGAFIYLVPVTGAVVYPWSDGVWWDREADITSPASAFWRTAGRPSDADWLGKIKMVVSSAPPFSPSRSPITRINPPDLEAKTGLIYVMLAGDRPDSGCNIYGARGALLRKYDFTFGKE